MAGMGAKGWARLAFALALAAIAYGYGQYQNDLAIKREKLSVVATAAFNPITCRDARKPFQVTIRNLTSRTVLAATFILYEDPIPAGTLPSDMPKVSLEAPLRAGGVHADCYALNRLRLVARNADPSRIHFVPMPSDIVFD